MKRESNYDLLRCTSCISIVLLHIAALYTEDISVISIHSNLDFSFCDFIQIITRTAVPCFVMLSGAFMLDKKRLIISEFYKKSFFKLGVPTIVFSLLYIIIRLLTGDAAQSVLFDTISGKPFGHLWYMFMLVGLYAAFPLIYYFCRNISDKACVIFGIIAIVLSSVVHFTCDLIWPIKFIEYLGYFVIGYCLRKWGKKIPGKWQLYLFISVLFLISTFLLNEYSFYTGSYDSDFFRHPDFPTIIIASLSCFVAFSKMRVTSGSKIYVPVVKYSMIIYMVHPMIYIAINKVVLKIFKGLPSPFWYVPALFVVCLFLSLIASIVYQKTEDVIKGIVRNK